MLEHPSIPYAVRYGVRTISRKEFLIFLPFIMTRTKESPALDDKQLPKGVDGYNLALIEAAPAAIWQLGFAEICGNYRQEIQECGAFSESDNKN